MNFQINHNAFVGKQVQIQISHQDFEREFSGEKWLLEQKCLAQCREHKLNHTIRYHTDPIVITFFKQP